ncbi:nucleoplasmin-3 [Athene cunicularia]|uniref:nucleoplasmin-3 n=1 Tax=Athene cunicularia TaxID=194338 RepID=UPI000EF73D29|nr:nucleoplasmin-3 [Athene cunicularia]
MDMFGYGMEPVCYGICSFKGGLQCLAKPVRAVLQQCSFTLYLFFSSPPLLASCWVLEVAETQRACQQKQGCELTASTKSYTFQVDKEDDSDHILALSVVCLTDGAKDECNVVEVIGRNHENQEIAVPVANLKLSCQPLLSLDNFKLQPPVTFRLAAGSGPVHLTGWHQIMHREDASFEEDDDLSEEEELPPIMPAKK